jgi:hypothetical protein
MANRLVHRRLAPLLAAVICTLGGCGSDMPFDLLPVSGKVTYEDGSLIKAESIRLAFNPAAAASGPITTPGGTAQVDVADGTFTSVTTRRTGDGLAACRYKVVVVPFKKGPQGGPTPTDAVAAKYQKETTTPLEIEVNEANQFIEIKVSKK